MCFGLLILIVINVLLILNVHLKALTVVPTTSAANSAPPKILHTLLEVNTNSVSINMDTMNTIKSTIIVVFMVLVNGGCKYTMVGFLVLT